MSDRHIWEYPPRVNLNVERAPLTGSGTPRYLYVARYRCCHRVSEALAEDNQPGPPALYQPKRVDIDDFVFHALRRGESVERIPLAEAEGLRFGCGCPVAQPESLHS